MCKNPYKSIRAKIEKVIVETPTIKTLVLKPERPLSFESGQFMQVGVPGMGECPFTPSSDYQKTATIEFSIMKAGSVTAKLHEMKAGQEVEVRGPYGKPYPIRDYHGKEVYVVGGGVGLAPLRAFLFALSTKLINSRRLRFALELGPLVISPTKSLSQSGASRKIPIL